MPEALELNSVTGVILYYITRVVEKLVFSSPDAGATKVPSIYPREPPKVKCKTKSNICLNILKRRLKPVLNINTISHGLYLRFTEPNHEDPLNLEAAAVER
ncbi:hypothetical protein EJD97_007589 [Solanum chilense]|uniref:UBC core domain-containing protein n=1 Tax=Solanum chilense TaxID=4083 RepID=A0A6N2CD70_SOLCI|nr:hypothetical protein EJD97_007589 [Solanum chilense]